MSAREVVQVVAGAKDLISATSRRLEASYFLLGLLTLRYGNTLSKDVDWPQAAEWSRISDAKSLDSIVAAVSALSNHEDTQFIGRALRSLGMESKEAFGARVDYGAQRTWHENEESLLARFTDFVDSVEPDDIGSDKLSSIVDQILDIGGQGIGRSTGEHYTPSRLADLIAEILNPDPDSSICDPTAGTGGLLLSLLDASTKTEDESQTDQPDLFGQETNSQVAALAQLNIYLHGARATIFTGDTLLNPGFTTESGLKTFDFVAANPPIRLRLDSDTQGELRSDPYGRFHPESISRTADIAFVQHVAASLNENGRAIMVVSPGLLRASGREKTAIRRLVDQDLVEAALMLPGGFLEYTSIPIGLLVLRRGKPSDMEGHIMFAEVEDFENEERKLSHGQSRRIIASLNKHSEIPDFSLKVSAEEVLENNCVLSPARYVAVSHLDKLLGGIGERRELSDIANIFRGNRLTDTGKGEIHFVQAGDISGDKVFKDELQAHTSATEVDRDVSEISVCQKGDILMKATAPFDVAIADGSLQGVPVNQHVIILRLNPNHDHLRQFLVEFFGSDTARRLLSSIAGGAYIRRLKISELRSLKVPVADESFIKLIDDLRAVESRLDARRESIEELRKQLFNMRDTSSSKAHVRDLSSEVQVLSSSLVQASDLGYQVRNFYPFPIAYRYRNLAGISEESRLREELRNIAENLLAFLGCLGLSIVYNEENGVRDFLNSNNKLKGIWTGGANFGNWQDLAYLTGKHLRKNTSSSLGADYASIWFQGEGVSSASEFYQLTEKLTVKRNTDAHGRETTFFERQERTAQLERMVDEAYEAVSFLIKYPLHLVKSTDKRWGKDSFEVKSLVYVGDHPGMRIGSSNLSNPPTKGILYVEVGDDSWIPLYPLISVSYCPKCHYRETFLLERMGSGRRCEYKSFERGHEMPKNEGDSTEADLKRFFEAGES